MNIEHIPEMSFSPEESLESRIAKIAAQISLRDSKQAEFIRLLRESNKTNQAPAGAWDAWLQLQDAQNTLDGLMKAAMRGR